MQAMYNHKISPSFPFVSSSIHGTSDTFNHFPIKTVKPQGENMQNRCRALSFLDIYQLILLSCPSSLSPTLLPYFQTWKVPLTFTYMCKQGRSFTIENIRTNKSTFSIVLNMSEYQVSTISLKSDKS